MRSQAYELQCTVAALGTYDARTTMQTGPQIENHVRFPRRVNAGFMQVVSRGQIRLRVFERGVGETGECR